MKVLIIGSGGRENALAWKLAQSSKVKKIFSAPGNPGLENFGPRINIKATDIKNLLDFAKKERIDLTVVGPEDPLVQGICDEFRREGLIIFGPSRKAAQLEGSKDFCRDICKRAGVKVAEGQTFTVLEKALAFLEKSNFPLVIKADGLAAGKGVSVVSNREDAQVILKKTMQDKCFGPAGEKVIIEEFLKGFEVSVLAVCSGLECFVLEPSQDHKPVFDGDQGPNTGGMGTYSPVPVFSSEQTEWVKTRIIQPVLKTMNDLGTPFSGVLYAGLMVMGKGDIRLLEFNARFGDPETQAILPRMKGDFFDLLWKSARGQSLDQVHLEWEKESCVCVIAASKGYPGIYQKGFPISGLNLDFGKKTFIFHAGTEKSGNRIVTSGGRVLGVSSLGKTLAEAKEKSYSALNQIHFEGIHFRKDISEKAFKIKESLSFE